MDLESIQQLQQDITRITVLHNNQLLDSGNKQQVTIVRPKFRNSGIYARPLDLGQQLQLQQFPLTDEYGVVTNVLKNGSPNNEFEVIIYNDEHASGYKIDQNEDGEGIRDAKSNENNQEMINPEKGEEVMLLVINEEAEKVQKTLDDYYKISKSFSEDNCPFIYEKGENFETKCRGPALNDGERFVTDEDPVINGAAQDLATEDNINDNKELIKGAAQDLFSEDNIINSNSLNNDATQDLHIENNIINDDSSDDDAAQDLQTELDANNDNPLNNDAAQELQIELSTISNSLSNNDEAQIVQSENNIINNNSLDNDAAQDLQVENSISNDNAGEVEDEEVLNYYEMSIHNSDIIDYSDFKDKEAVNRVQIEDNDNRDGIANGILADEADTYGKNFNNANEYILDDIRFRSDLKDTTDAAPIGEETSYKYRDDDQHSIREYSTVIVKKIKKRFNPSDLAGLFDDDNNTGTTNVEDNEGAQDLQIVNNINNNNSLNNDAQDLQVENSIDDYHSLDNDAAQDLQSEVNTDSNNSLNNDATHIVQSENYINYDYLSDNDASQDSQIEVNTNSNNSLNNDAAQELQIELSTISNSLSNNDEAQIVQSENNIINNNSLDIDAAQDLQVENSISNDNAGEVEDEEVLNYYEMSIHNSDIIDYSDFKDKEAVKQVQIEDNDNRDRIANGILADEANTYWKNFNNANEYILDDIRFRSDSNDATDAAPVGEETFYKNRDDDQHSVRDYSTVIVKKSKKRFNPSDLVGLFDDDNNTRATNTEDNESAVYNESVVYHESALDLESIPITSYDEKLIEDTNEQLMLFKFLRI
ncbi:hypothetical protein KGF54_005316 [Candida jiufengensis]|uniref:uncharacterized protein n=1 Tax=Candida jiufengensis TaxID=497108 RepID=UPI002224CFFB|nr:uncharacterized protein KGF54_005316 [Candida jiufengensis]KAI5950168.1 hypothetical protein KGF54_005316 [Candida jiufengensis]